jgi:hypothetical protein
MPGGMPPRSLLVPWVSFTELRVVIYEPKNQRPIPRASFARRLLVHLGLAACILVLSLGVGMVGYVQLEHLSWMDAFLNSAMLLGGMGPVDLPKTEGGKLFAGIYALYAGLVFIATAALVFTPVLHRVIHHFHWSEKL